MSLSNMRDKWGKGVIFAIIILIGFVFVFWGVFTPDPSFTGAVAGSVNGERITFSEFSRELNQRMQLYRQMKFPVEQLKKLGIQKTVFDSLAQKKLLVQAAEKAGLEPSEEEIRGRIREIPAFQEEGGGFDLERYEQVLEANRFTPGTFERLIRQELMRERWQDYFRSLVRISELELRQEYRLKNDKRKLRYVHIKREVGRGALKVSSQEVQAFLGDAQKQALVKSRFDANKDRKYKGKKFEQVQNEIARELIRLEKTGETEKFIGDLGEKVAAVLNHTKKSEKKVNALLKKYKTKAKSTGELTRDSFRIPGVGEVEGLVAAAFADDSPIDTASGGKAKVFKVSSGVVVAAVEEATRPDYAKFDDKAREQLINSLSARKRGELFNEWLKGLTDKADIKMNQSVTEFELGA